MPTKRIEGTPFRAGACVGLFIGTLLGLSGSPIVATFLGVVSSLGAAILASRSKEAESEEASWKTGASGAFVAGFGLVGTVALLVAVYLRAHGSLGPSPGEVRDQWIRMGVPREDATQLAMRQWASISASGSTSESKSSLAPYLFAVGSDALMELDPTGRSLGAVRKQWREAGGIWSNVVTQAEGWGQLDDAQKSAALAGFWKAVLQSK